MNWVSTKPPPMTETELRTLWAGGDPLAEIAQKARHRNGIGRAKVRAIIFDGDFL